MKGKREGVPDMGGVGESTQSPSLSPTLILQSSTHSTLKTLHTQRTKSYSFKKTQTSKPALDATQPNNYIPISKLPFISKILGIIVTQQVIRGHSIFNKFQSGFHHQHSTETAVLRVTNDTLK